MANLPANLNAVKVNSSSFRVSWTPPATVTGYQVYWSGVGGCDSDNMSVGAGDTAVTITGLTPGLTYDVTIVALSDHLPSPVVGPVMITVWYTCSDGETHNESCVLGDSSREDFLNQDLLYKESKLINYTLEVMSNLGLLNQPSVILCDPNHTH